MFAKFRLYFKHFDWALFLPVVLLSAFGLVEIYSVALGQESVDFLNFKKQVLFVVIGIFLYFFFAFLDVRFLKSISRYLYFLGAVFLLAVLVMGQTINGTKGWFSVAGFGIQPVELVKLILILFLADFFARLSMRVKTLKSLIVSGLYTLGLVALVLAQPDFGSALILSAIWLVIIALAGFKKKYFVVIFLIGVVVFTLSWFVFFKEYQKQRVITFLNPGQNALESGYNSSQAMIAVGSGGIMGKGVGFGSQSQLRFLPEAQSDFIFAVIAEELGFFGVFLVLVFFSIFFFRSLYLLKTVKNDFEAYFIVGGVGLIFIQMFINMGMNMGILPVVGLPLPFVSSGGSSIISCFILVGIIQSIAINTRLNY